MRSSMRSALQRGREAGYRAGWRRGYHLGRCQAVVQRVPPVRLQPTDKRVLYIPQGFVALDRGIIEGFQGIVKELIVGSPQDTLRLAESTRPDLVLVLNGMHVFPPEYPSHIDQIRAMSIKTAIWFADDPYFSDDSARLALHYDYVFTHELSCVPFYREIGCPRVHYLPLAVATSLYKPLPAAVESRYRSDICFIGVGFPNRVRFFNRLVPYFARKRVVIVGALWDRLTHYRRISDQVHLEWVPEEETVKYYNGALVVINHHRASSDPVHNKNRRELPAYSVNPRTYEIAACGAFQLTDVREDLGRLYTPGYDIATYSSAEDLIRQIDYYLRHEEERRQIALRGLRRTWTEHIFPLRLKQMLRVVFGES